MRKFCCPRLLTISCFLDGEAEGLDGVDGPVPGHRDVAEAEHGVGVRGGDVEQGAGEHHRLVAL